MKAEAITAGVIKILRLKIIACDVLNREISYLASQSRHYVDVTFLSQGLHDTPDKLRKMVQAEIDRANKGFPYNYYNTCPAYDYIILGYGLCSNGTAGVVSRNIPMVIPRAHDCITLLMGSKDKYKSSFEEYPGTYWFSSGWIERGWQPGAVKYSALLKEYTEKYGEENAEYLMEMEQSWMKEYHNAGFISWECFGNNQFYREFTKKSAEFFGWDFIEVRGDSSLLKNIINGRFNSHEVLVVPPNTAVKPSYDDGIIEQE